MPTAREVDHGWVMLGWACHPKGVSIMLFEVLIQILFHVIRLSCVCQLIYLFVKFPLGLFDGQNFDETSQQSGFLILKNGARIQEYPVVFNTCNDRWVCIAQRPQDIIWFLKR